jgi:hypothetical protein
VSNARVPRPADARSIGVRGAAIAAALLLAGALAAAATVAARASGTSASSNVRRGLNYTCSFPAGTVGANSQTNVRVTIAATFPAAATAGQRIQQTGVQITVSLPPPAVATLRESGATAVSTTALLSVEAIQRTTTMTTRWQGTAPTAQPLPATGRLTIAASGRATPVTVSSRGTVTFSAANLNLVLYLDSATGSSAASHGPSPSASDGSPSPGSSDSAAPGSANPGVAELHVACTPASHRGTVLDAIPVASASSKPHPKSPAGRHKLKLPKGCGHIKVIGSGTAVCGYITGFSDVAKLYGAALLQPKRPARPALVNIDFAYRHFLKPGKLIALSTGELDYQGHRQLPPVRTTFLAFRFVPVTATLKVTELTPIKIRSVSGITAPPYPITVRATTRVSIRISDVDVNGVPLAIGPHCRPVSSPRLTLVGRGDNTIPPKGYTVPTGGPLSGRLTIPAFTHCGVTENLDPLLTGSISGPGNFVLMTQGRLCGPSQPAAWTCPPPVPKPIH